MQTTTFNHSYQSRSGGGRIASEAYRASLTQCDDFTGLEAGTNRYELLLLVKKVGKLAGFTPRMICLLDYYFAFTRDIDWEQGARPIVYQSLSRTALDMGVSERQIQKLEAALFAAGAITWNDSGNHKRYGQRDGKTGQILWAFGVDLTPLSYLREELEAKLHEKQLYDEAWMVTKRNISWFRRQIRAHLAEWEDAEWEEGSQGVRSSIEAQYDEIAIQLRTHLDLATLRDLLARHKQLHVELVEAMGIGDTSAVQSSQAVLKTIKTPRCSCRSEPKDVHYKSTTQTITRFCSRTEQGFQKSVGDPSRPAEEVPGSGMAHITLKMALGAASERLAALLPIDPDWMDIVEAAYHLRAELGISQERWGEACRLLGRNGAAVCLLVTDRAADRLENPVRVPAAYYAGMVRRAEEGTLRLHRSLFGLLKS